MKALIEQTVQKNGEKAHVVSHSLGGPATLGFLSKMPQDWKDQHLQSFVPISPPFAGASMQLTADVSGDNFNVPVVPHDYVKQIQSTAPSGSCSRL